MEYRKKLFLTVISFVFATSSVAEVTRLDLYTQEFPPLQVQVDDVAEGYVVKFVEAIVEEASKSIEVEIANIYFMPWKRALRNTQHNENTLFFSISRTPEREDNYHWIGEVSPYEVSLYRHVGGSAVDVHSVSDLKDYRFAAQVSSAFEEWLKEQGFNQIVPVNYGKEAIRLLKAHRVDLAPLVDASYYYRMEQYDFEPSEFVKVMKVDSLSKSLWLVTGKKTSRHVVEALTASFESLKAKGALQHLIERYHPDSEVMLRYRQQVDVK